MGVLYIVATPIGNLKDITLRAIEILKEVSYILCEDTRVSARLLNYYKIQKPMVSFNDFNEKKRIHQIIGDLTLGKKIALISDAGTPLISDPGFKLIQEAVKTNLKVESIPGPSAAIAALTSSGLPPDKFLFIGYLPKKEARKKEVLKKLRSMAAIIKMTIIVYESPHRLLKTLESIKEVFGDVEMVICRELTKLHEEVRREKISQSINHFLSINPKGEFTLLLSLHGN